MRPMPTPDRPLPLLAFLAALLLAAPAAPQGGTYVGPGDTVPQKPQRPGDGKPANPGSPRGGGKGLGDTVPSGEPGEGAVPGSGLGPAAGPAAGPGESEEGEPGANFDVHTTDWRTWWWLNRAPYLDLKATVQSGTLSGDAGFFLGHGQEEQSGLIYAPSRETIERDVLPTLLHEIESSDSGLVVREALMAAARVGDSIGENGVSPVRDAVRTRLSDPVRDVRETAVLALGVHGSPSSLGDLYAIAADARAGRLLVGNPESPVAERPRALATYGLGLVGSASSDPALRRQVARALFDLLRAPRHATADVKVAAAIAMGLVPLEPGASPSEAGVRRAWDSRLDQIAALIELLEPRHAARLRDVERAHVIGSIGRLAQGASPSVHTVATNALVRAAGGRVRAESALVRQSAVLALGELGDCDDDALDARIRRSLFGALEDPDGQVQGFALIALGRLGGSVRTGTGEGVARAAIRERLADELDRGTRRRPWAALAIGLMERRLSDAGAPVSDAQLGRLGEELLATRSGDTAGASAVGLGIARRREATPALLERLDEGGEDDVRGHVAVALGLIRAPGAKDELRKVALASRSRGRLLAEVGAALGLYGDRDAARTLEEMLRTQATSSWSSSAITSALGAIGDAGSVRPLLDVARDVDLPAASRASAIRALGVVGEKELLPWNAKLTAGLNYRAATPTLVRVVNGGPLVL